MHYYQFNIADYRKDTIHLTPIEHYIYRSLIDWYYLDEQPIPKITQSVMRRLGVGFELEQFLQNVLQDFFFESPEGWRHKRIDQEITEYHSKCDTNKNNGKRGGRPKKTQSVISGNRNESETKANETLTNNHKPLTNNQEPLKPSEVITITESNKTCMSTQTAPTPKKATRLPENWVLPKAWGDWALQEKPHLTADDIRLMAEMFRDHWLANASRATGKKDDWQATWRNWVRRSDPNKANVPKTGKTYHESTMDTAAQIFGRKYGSEHTVIDITPRSATGSDPESFSEDCNGLRAALA